MSGFETSRANTGSKFSSKQFGSILRGFGPPVPQAGVTGDLYIDNTTFQLFEKRSVEGLDDWGHYLFVVPANYQAGLKFFGSSFPLNSIGIPGDYFLQWSGYPNYGMQPSIWGPKGWAGWPENGVGLSVAILDSAIRQIGIADEGPNKTDLALTQLLAVGLFDEYIIPVSVTADVNDPVLQLGMQTTGTLITVAINSVYTAEDRHAV